MDGSLTLDKDSVRFIKTIADANVHGTATPDAWRVVGFLMAGWTLHAAKHKVYVEDAKAKR